MFYYYGRKKQIVRHYPPPECSVIIEPFAGSAAYALHGDNWKKRVILVEKDEQVAGIWKWLIESATPEELRNMPELRVGERSSEFFHIIHAATKMAFHFKRIKVTPVLARNWEISRRLIAANVHKVKHWKIICGDYTQAPHIEATWFIDPPYKGKSGMGYRHNSKLLDYTALAIWTKNRIGQVISCEGDEGDYLPFIRLRDQMGVAGKTSKEVIYHRSSGKSLQPTLFDNVFIETLREQMSSTR
jgi:site-specific DNA-adenine methylase